MVVLMDSMRRIKALSETLLLEKVNEAAAISPDDSATKKDIMSLLVRARSNAEKVTVGYEKGPTPATTLGNYRMSNKGMMDQVVCDPTPPTSGFSLKYALADFPRCWP